MQKIIDYLNNNKMSYKDSIVFIYIEKYPYKTSQQIAHILGCDYSRLSKTLNKLIELDLIDKTPETPMRYMTKKND